jgi:hypothetical protein
MPLQTLVLRHKKILNVVLDLESSLVGHRVGGEKIDEITKKTTEGRCFDYKWGGQLCLIFSG